MSNRRAFLSRLGAGLAALAPWTRGTGRGALRVDAEPSVFYAHPDGQRNLVRFHVSGVDAPAGRLRVYDRRSQLVGTAGVLRRGENLYGELWLPLDGSTRLRSELEAPGVRGVFRTTHQLEPPPRWVLRWLTFVDAEALARDLRDTHPVSGAVQLALLRGVGARALPLGTNGWDHVTDHLPYLSGPARATREAAALGLEISPIAAVDAPTAVPWTAVTLLAEAGIDTVVTPWTAGASAERWTGPDRSYVRVAHVAPGGDARSLALVGPDDMARAVERWLTTSPPLLARAATGRTDRDQEALVVDSSPADDLDGALARVFNWNQRFAYPRIVIGPPADAAVPAAAYGETSRVERPGPVTGAVPEALVLRWLADARERAWRAAATDSAGLLAAALGSGPTAPSSMAGGFAQALDVIGAEVRTRFAGTLVWNPTPYRRTDLAAMPDGSHRLVTDVPAWGYAFLVDTAAEHTGPLGAIEHRDLPTLECWGFSARVDERSGAIRSLADGDGREWVRADGPGLNVVPGARLESAELAPASSDAVRLVLRRWSPEFGEITSTVTAHRDQPWLDVENIAAPLGSRGVDYHFGFELPEPEVLWEIPAGYEAAPAPVGPVALIRWLGLRAAVGAAWLTGLHTAYASAGADGHVVSHAPRGVVRYRFGVTGFRISPAECARLGWSVVPLVSRAASGNPDGRLPTHGRLLRFDQEGLALLGMVPAETGDGLTVFLHDLYGEDRYIAVAEGLLGFERAVAVDLVGRETPSGVSRFTDGIVVHVRPRGIAAVRLEGLRLVAG